MAQPINRFMMKPVRWLRIASLAVVVTLSAALVYNMRTTPPTYTESADILFSLPRTESAPNAYYIFAPALITTAEDMSQTLSAPVSKHRIRLAGGTASVTVELVNLHSEEYPEYGEPLTVLTATSQSAVETHRTFVIASRLLHHIFVSRQNQAGVRPRNRITTQVIADTGPIIQTGSVIRAYAGTGLLALLAVGLAWAAIARRFAGPGRDRPVRPGPAAPGPA